MTAMTEAGAPVKPLDWRGHGRFEAMVVRHADALLRYCRRKAGTEWEAQDLLQDALEKAYVAFRKNPDRPLAPAYLYRIAANAWVDRCRRSREVPLTLTDDLLGEREGDARRAAADSTDIRSALEALVAHLPALQRTVVLLVDVLRYSAAEAAALLHTTEGAVKASLHRARKRLELLQSGLGLVETKPGSEVDQAEVDAYLHAFQQMDAQRIVRIAGGLPSQPESCFRPYAGMTASPSAWARSA